LKLVEKRKIPLSSWCQSGPPNFNQIKLAEKEEKWSNSFGRDNNGVGFLSLMGI